MTFLLSARSALHRFVRSVLSEDEVRDGLIFAAATLIVLPLMPDQAMGPFSALNPHSIWIIVILVMAIGAFGDIAVRLLGARFGLPIAGLASGFISSTATIGVMGARAVKAPYLLGPATAGAVLSTVATVIQLVLLLAATNMATLRALLVPLACAGAAALAYGSVFTIRALRDSSGEVDERGRAFSLKTAFLFAAMLSGVLLASTALNEWFGATGVVVAAAVAGFVDTHSAAISVATLVGAGKTTATDDASRFDCALYKHNHQGSHIHIRRRRRLCFARHSGFGFGDSPPTGRDRSYTRPELLRRGAMRLRTCGCRSRVRIRHMT